MRTSLGILVIAVTTSCLPALAPRGDETEVASGKEPYMEIVTPERLEPRGLVVAGPHVGYERGTGIMVKALARSRRAPAVLAHGYRSLAEGRFINVNRPTQCRLDGEGQPRGEETTPEGSRVFDRWVARVTEAGTLSGIDDGRPVSLYVEIHGHRRQARVNGTAERVQVIEVATVGYSEEKLQEALAHWEREQRGEPRLPDLVFDVTHPRYPHAGGTIPFRYRASRARSEGILQPRYVERALHFELPAHARKPELRNSVTPAVARLIESLLGS